MKESVLHDVKKKYEPLMKKYKLPSFSELNEEFEIEKIQDHETDFILREVRKSVGEKVGAFLRFLETILNPVVAPVFVLNSLKNLSNQDRDLIKKNYEVLVELEIKAISLDVEYDEKSEADFISKAYKKWQEIKPDIKDIIDSLRKAQETKEDKRKSYLG
jgi:hypothetical protein